MLFNSLNFFLFFPIVTFLYFALPHRFRWMLLLAASCVFYMSFIPSYILVLAVTIAIDFFAGIFIERKTGTARKVGLITSIVATLLVLFIFKYLNFFNANLTSVSAWLHWNYSVRFLEIVLPIGLSFHTFQSLSYVIEVYRGRQKAEHHFGIYALYVMFYPQLVAGPIERPQNLLHQFYEPHNFDALRVAYGLKRMLWGMFKKVVIADNAAVLVNQIYSSPHDYNGLYLFIATVTFAFQIYCDFSGYSDIAVGSAQVMGFSLMENFKSPYLATSIADFWHRWHISLSTWFRDYVYIPLGGSKAGFPRWVVSVLITFLLSGLWHGASWTYVLWGLLNGFYFIVGRLTASLRAQASRAIGLDDFPFLKTSLSIAVTFSLVCFSWIFFRANTVADAMYISSCVLAVFALPGIDLAPIAATLQPVVIFILFLLCIEFLVWNPQSWPGKIARKVTLLRWTAYYVAIALIVYYLNGTTPSQFIYFQF